MGKTSAFRPFVLLLIAGLGIILQFGSALARDSGDPIGRITYLDKKYWSMRINSDSGSRDAAQAGLIFEHDTIQTIAGQHLVVMLDEGTELLVGPSSHMTFKNWRERDSSNHLRREVALKSGMIKAKVRKVYSQDEPFLITNKYGAVAVRGTEFVFEAGPAGRLEYARRLTAAESYDRRHEVEVHVLEGEVYFARDVESLWKPEARVTIDAGRTSLVRLGMQRPQPSRYFDQARFRTYVMKAAPHAKFVVADHTTNTRRSERSTNVRQEDVARISPARPPYAKALKQSASGRSLAGDDDYRDVILKKEEESK